MESYYFSKHPKRVTAPVSKRYYAAKFQYEQGYFIVNLSGNAKQRRKMVRAFQRSPAHKGFTISYYKY